MTIGQFAGVVKGNLQGCFRWLKGGWVLKPPVAAGVEDAPVAVHADGAAGRVGPVEVAEAVHACREGVAGADDVLGARHGWERKEKKQKASTHLSTSTRVSTRRRVLSTR